jgi:acyl-CoA thioesterase-2
VDPDQSASSIAALLSVDPVDANTFRVAASPKDRDLVRLYGGQVAAQAMAAAGATVDDDRVPHSLHGYFVRSGTADRATTIAVDRDRDGRSFSTRHVNVRQDDEVIFSALVSFHVDEPSIDVQVPQLAPDARDPDALAERERVGHNVLLDARAAHAPESEAWQTPRFWVRVRESLPADRVTNACALTYLSDMGWAFDGLPERLAGPSLDHAVWLVRPVDLSDWLFVDLRIVSIAGSRGVFTGTIHDRAGTLAAYVTQEALLRRMP